MIAKSSKGAIALSLIASLNLYAADSESTRLDATVITTTGFESALKDEARNVTVITQEDVKNRGYRDLDEILDKAAGVSFVNWGAGTTVDMRGQGNQSNIAVKVLVNGVGAMNMIDSTPNPVRVNLIPIEDIERVEIIPGGGAVLYGNGTRGGVINIITKTRPRDFYAGVSSKLGSYGYKDLNLNVGGTVAERLFLKANVKGFKENTYRYGGDINGKYASLGITYKISDFQSISINPSYYKEKQSISPSPTKAQLAQNRRSAGAGENSANVLKRVGVSGDYSVNFEKIEASVTPFYQKIETTLDDSKFNDKKYGANFKAKYKYGSGNFIGGYDYQKNTGDRFLDFATGPMKFNYIYDIEKITHSFYFLETHDFTDVFSLSAGARYENADYDIFSNQKRIMGNSVLPVAGMPMRGNKKNNNYAYEITPNFKYSDSGNLYFKFERGFISPTPVQLIDKINRTTYRINNLKSEVYQTYETGVKDLVWGQFISATLFLTDTKDEIGRQTLGPSITDGWRYYNLTKTRRYGAELYAEQYLLDSLRLSQTFSYVKAKISSGADKGKEIPYVQKSKFILGIDYEPIRKFKILTDIKYGSSHKTASYKKVNGRTTVDLGVSYGPLKGFTIAAGVKNLLDKKYDIDIDVPARDRNYYVEFKYAY